MQFLATKTSILAFFSSEDKPMYLNIEFDS